ncbi:zymogen granule membrane protein 16-like [Aquarana catesbeiana]|uniref:zymogen granule membrane protein 16-like n=1 Tax=Aquarana catesbeiana TaxID=8400 RepID=UPI003CCA3773
MLTLLCACFLLGSTATSSVQSLSSSFSKEYGGGKGTPFSFSNDQRSGPITAIRIREGPSFLNGIHFRYGNHWAPFSGGHSGSFHEFLLHSGENITQVSGKFDSYVNELVFVTSHGRIFKVGQSSGTSFNDFPLFGGTVLRYISGRYSDVLNSIGFHWGFQPR